MEQGKQQQRTMALSLSSKGLPHQIQNPITQIQTRFKNIENGVKLWLSKQSIAVEAAVVATTSAAQGAVMGACMGTFTSNAPAAFAPPPNATLSPQAMASLKQAQALAGGPLIQARNFAVMTGVNAGISCVLKRLRGKEDVQSR
ncbi:chloroplastic import inner membrane translocase subunit HP30-2 [Lathyrus oleraceus]|uniref:chloroplastic import inner membrane translocase subunit HP30-2 n=1 Tax=Pisum sativum TaxID=3888 RepID=UPI0021CEA3FB|nr:chloroplastic import inner membrane translocase subunit HP30-2-like [Pisum sativum]XP_050904033.1 chloroplastic import inner membrane translocase subunit HP30-2-like [Pisum sativum]